MSGSAVVGRRREGGFEARDDRRPRALVRRVTVVVACATIVSSAAVALVVETGSLRTHLGADGARARAAVRYLESLRVALPPEAHVLVLTGTIPAPDFDFWFGPLRKTVVLAQVTPEFQVSRADQADHLPADLLGFLRRHGVLLDGESLARELPRADFVLVTEPLADADLERTLASETRLVRVVDPLRLLRRSP